jgi:hypothetical protein
MRFVMSDWAASSLALITVDTELAIPSMLLVSASLIESPIVWRISSLTGTSSSLTNSSRGAGMSAVTGASVASINSSRLSDIPSVTDASCPFSDSLTATTASSTELLICWKIVATILLICRLILFLDGPIAVWIAAATSSFRLSIVLRGRRAAR